MLPCWGGHQLNAISREHSQQLGRQCPFLPRGPESLCTPRGGSPVWYWSPTLLIHIMLFTFFRAYHEARMCIFLVLNACLAQYLVWGRAMHFCWRNFLKLEKYSIGSMIRCSLYFLIDFSLSHQNIWCFISTMLYNLKHLKLACCLKKSF